jgi:hypothetical protein
MLSNLLTTAWASDALVAREMEFSRANRVVASVVGNIGVASDYSRDRDTTRRAFARRSRACCVPAYAGAPSLNLHRPTVQTRDRGNQD